MPEKTKPEQNAERIELNDQKRPPAPPDCETGANPTWAQDQREHVYYYDDSHGYELYNPEEDEEE